MQKRRIVLVLTVLSFCLIIAGCGPDTAAELKKSQANLAACDRQAAELNTQLVKSQATIAKQQQDLEQTKNDLKFFANKVNPLEQQGYDLKAKIEALNKELDDTKKALAEANKTIADMKAAQPAPAAPAATNGSAPKVQ